MQNVSIVQFKVYYVNNLGIDELVKSRIFHIKIKLLLHYEYL